MLQNPSRVLKQGTSTELRDLNASIGSRLLAMQLLQRMADIVVSLPV